ncbi:MAG: hypothetical protein JRF36_02175 [Deltaproteobacteria bacterium]|jgi:hypothetical protein|nr:hypothetical protein [Deltaproteobacteria bacterium]
MKVFFKLKYLPVLLICGWLVLPSNRSLGAVIVYDQVTTVNTPVYLKVLTKGKIFADGGRLVEFFLDDKSLGKNLTGGDGYGYRKYVPQRAGIIKVRATSDGESGNGMVLVMKRSEKAILIEIEGGFKDAVVSEIAAGAGRQAVQEIQKKYRVIYLSRNTGVRMARTWLDEIEMPDAPVLRWKGAQTLSALIEKGIQLYAIIGAAGVIEAAADYVDKRYTFDDAQQGQTVKDWHELMIKLEKSGPDNSENSKKESKP